MGKSASKHTEPVHCGLIRRNLTKLCERIDIIHSGLYEKLLEKGALSREDVRKIKKTNAAGSFQVAALLEYLEKQTETVFIKFKESLIETGQAYIVDEILESGGEASDLTRWQCAIAEQYHQTLGTFPVYEITDDPKMVSLNQLYTRTDITDTTGWPPSDTNRTYEDYSSMFLMDKSARKRVLLLGSPGMGKSMLGHQMALDWSDMISVNKGNKATSEQDIRKEKTDFLKQFKLLLHIDLSNIRPYSSLHEVISQHILVDKTEKIQRFINYVTLNQKKCLFILDGWDEYDPSFCPEITDIANGQSIPGATILINSRIREQTVLPKSTAAQCMIKGFNQVQAKQFIDKILKLSHSERSADELVTFISDHHLWGVFCVPLMLNYLCLLYTSGSQLTEKVTHLFYSIIELTLKRHKLKVMKKLTANIKVDVPQYQNEMSNLGRLGYTGLENNNTRTVFSTEEAIHIGGENILDLGLLHKVRSQNPLSSSCLLTFGHKSLQEFVAAIYLTNSQKAFDHFYNYLDSLIKIYDCQLLVTFVCGINPDFGRQLIQRILEISMTDTATAADCPQFSYRGWTTDKPGPGDLVLRHVTTASDVTPFLIQCCWEMTQTEGSVNIERFPFTPGSDISATKLQPNINIKLINLYHTSQLLINSLITFNEGSWIRLYNMSNDEDNDKYITQLLDDVSQNLSDISDIDITNVKSDIKCKSLTALFNTSYKDVRMYNVDILPSDLLDVIHQVSVMQTLVELYLRCVTVTGCEEALCDAITQLVSLRRLILRSLSLSGYQARLCDAVSHLKHLQKLSLLHTDMSGSGDHLIDCLIRLSLLTYLNLGKTNLTLDQTRRVVNLLPSCPGLMYLNLYRLPVSAAVDELTDAIPGLIKLGFLGIIRGGLNTQQTIRVFSCLPAAIQVVEADGNDTQDDIIDIGDIIHRLPNIHYVYLNLSSVSSGISQQLKAAFQQTGAVLISSQDDYIKHGAGLVKIINELL